MLSAIRHAHIQIKHWELNCLLQHNGVVEYLLALREINVDTRDTSNGYTPLMYAAVNNFNRMVELLLKKVRYC